MRNKQRRVSGFMFNHQFYAGRYFALKKPNWSPPRTAMLQGAENKLFSKIVFIESFFCKIFFQLKSLRACFFELLLLKIFWNNYFDQRPESRAHLDFYFHNIKLNIFQHLLSANYQFFTQQMISWFEKSIF